MSSELVIVKLDGLDAQREVSTSLLPKYSVVRSTTRTSVSGRDDVGFAFLDVKGKRIDADSLEEVRDTLKSLDPKEFSLAGDNSSSVSSWEASYGNSGPVPVEVAETEFVSEYLGFLVKRVSLLIGTTWHLPSSRFVVIPRTGTTIEGSFQSPGEAAGLAKKLDQVMHAELARKRAILRRKSSL